MNVLIGFEESQTVCIEFRKREHDAYSCDIQECSGGHPEWHLKMDIRQALRLKKWDIIILHPPCTCIGVCGNGTYGVGKPKHHMRIEAVQWTQIIWDEAIQLCDKVCMENPVGLLNSLGDFPEPQYIQPWQFGHGETKKTGLWLYGLPELRYTHIVKGRDQRVWRMAPSPERGKLRSKTYTGIAWAMGNQWG